MKKNNKKYIVLITILIVYALIMFIIFLPNFKSRKRKIYMFIETDALWQYENGKWTNMSDTKQYNWQKFDIYENNIFRGSYYTLLNSTWHLYNDDTKPVKLETPTIMGIRSKDKYQVAEFNLEDISANDMKYVDEVLTENNITSREFTYAKTISFDLDSDDEIEKIFVISNLFTEKFTSKIFNFIFILKGDRITLVSKTVDEFTNMYNHCHKYISGIIDIDNNSKYELVTGCKYFGTNKKCFELYEDNKGYEKIKACD